MLAFVKIILRKYTAEIFPPIPHSLLLLKEEKLYIMKTFIEQVSKDVWICSTDLKYLVYWFIFY